MDRLWTPWRYQYIATNPAAEEGPCVFCSAQDATSDSDFLILYRGPLTFGLLNLYPYTSGHLLIVTRRHFALLTEATYEELFEMMRAARHAQAALQEAYRPQGFNLGMNQGGCAGAGVAGHLHLHLLPRWKGDASFMSVVAETRILPESLQQTYARLLPHFTDFRG